MYSRKIPFAHKVFLALSAYLLGTYICTPQFNVDIIPIVAVLAIQGAPLYVWEIFNVLIILTWFQSSSPTLAGSVPQTMALLRAAGLAWMAVSTYWKVRLHQVLER